MAMVELTKEQLKQRGEELASKVIELAKLQDKNKDKKKTMKTAETEIEEEISTLALQVKTGQEEVEDQHDAFPETKPKKKKPDHLSAVENPPEDEDPKH